MKIKRFDKSRLRHMELFQFANHLFLMCTEANIAKLNGLLPPLRRAIDKFDEALNLPRRLVATEELKVLDKQRDDAHMSLRLLMKAHLRSDDAVMLRAAKKLQEVLGRYPRTAVSNYDKESAMIYNLLQDLRDPDMQTELAVLGVGPVVDRLERVNDAFEKEVLRRIHSVIPSGTFDTRALRAAVDAEVTAVVKRIASLDDLEPGGKLASLIREYDNVVDGWRMLLAKRRGTNRAARERELARITETLSGLIPTLEFRMGFESGSVKFTGSTRMINQIRYYELVVEGGEMLWARIVDGELTVVPEPKRKKPKRRPRMKVVRAEVEETLKEEKKKEAEQSAASEVKPAKAPDAKVSREDAGAKNVRTRRGGLEDIPDKELRNNTG